MSKITIEQIISEVRRLAKQWPDNIYKKPSTDGTFQGMCSYDKGACEPSGEIGCIFGQAFRNLGMELTGSHSIDEVLTNQLDIEASHPLMNWCKLAQSQQDDERPWEECIEFADSCSGEITLFS